MKQNLHILFLFLVLSNLAYAQENLVPNPSFEQYNTCPNNNNDISGICHSWSSFRVTADYYNACSSSFWNSFNNNFGFQLPRTGNAYAGFLNYSPIEHFGTELFSPLEVGVRYYVSFYVSCAYRYQGINIATNKIGARFTTYQYYEIGNEPLPNGCQIYTNEIITDTLNWVKISGSFVADSAYRYIIIGRFFDNMSIDTTLLPFIQQAIHSYYYVDDVCVSTDPILCGVVTDSTNTESCNFFLPSAFTPNNDGANDTYKVEYNCNDIELFSLRVFNRWGELVFATSDYNTAWDGNYKGVSQPSGVYIVSLSVVAQGKHISKSGSITLIR